MAALNCDPTIDYANDPMVIIGKMGDIKCPHCKALKWTSKTPSMCCAGGKVKLPYLGTPPEPLKSLLPGQHPRSREFLNNARKYNSCFSDHDHQPGVAQDEGGFLPRPFSLGQS